MIPRNDQKSIIQPLGPGLDGDLYQRVVVVDILLPTTDRFLEVRVRTRDYGCPSDAEELCQLIDLGRRCNWIWGSGYDRLVGTRGGQGEGISG